MMSEFDMATAVTMTGPGEYRAQLAEGWGVWDTINGGYLSALAATAMARAGRRPHPLSLTTHFLRPAQPGPVTVVTDILAAGSRLSRMRAEIHQADRTIVAAMGAFGELADVEDDLLVTGAPPQLSPVIDCVVPNRAAAERASVADRIDARMAAGDSGWIEGNPSGTMQFSAWLRFSDGRPADPLGLIFLADAMPPPIFNSGLGVSWVPTLEMTTHVRRFPAPGWLRFTATSRFATAGTVEEDVEIWDADDRLVAQARQLALLR